MTMKSRIRGVAIPLVLAAGTTASGQSFQLIPSPLGSSGEQALTISADGSTVLGFAALSTSSVVWWWRGTGTPTLVSGTNIDLSAGIGVSGDGSVAIWAPSNLTAQSQRYAIATGTYQGFPAFGSSIPRFGCMSADGSLFAGQYYVPPHDREVGAWNEVSDHIFFPGLPPSQNQGYTLACSGNGTTATGYAYEYASGFGQAFSWNVNGSAVGLGAFDPLQGFGMLYSAGLGVSGDGSVIVGWALSGGVRHPFRWTSGSGLVDLGLPAGASAAGASAVSPDGSIIVGQTSTGTAGCFVWDSGHGLRDLRGLLLSQGVTNGLDTVTLTSATAISADGVTIVGAARDEQGVSHGYIARLGNGTCYANCDGSSVPPVLNANDFQCFLNKFAAGDSYANCDQSTGSPGLNAADFACFMNKFAAGC
jgi:probable HAF family extracellular repeat protein